MSEPTRSTSTSPTSPEVSDAAKRKAASRCLAASSVLLAALGAAVAVIVLWLVLDAVGGLLDGYDELYGFLAQTDVLNQVLAVLLVVGLWALMGGHLVRRGRAWAAARAAAAKKRAATPASHGTEHVTTHGDVRVRTDSPDVGRSAAQVPGSGVQSLGATIVQGILGSHTKAAPNASHAASEAGDAARRARAAAAAPDGGEKGATAPDGTRRTFVAQLRAERDEAREVCELLGAPTRGARRLAWLVVAVPVAVVVLTFAVRYADVVLADGLGDALDEAYVAADEEDADEEDDVAEDAASSDAADSSASSSSATGGRSGASSGSAEATAAGLSALLEAEGFDVYVSDEGDYVSASMDGGSLSDHWWFNVMIEEDGSIWDVDVYVYWPADEDVEEGFAYADELVAYAFALLADGGYLDDWEGMPDVAFPDEFVAEAVAFAAEAIEEDSIFESAETDEGYELWLWYDYDPDGDACMNYELSR